MLRVVVNIAINGTILKISVTITLNNRIATKKVRQTMNPEIRMENRETNDSCLFFVNIQTNEGITKMMIRRRIPRRIFS